MTFSGVPVEIAGMWRFGAVQAVAGAPGYGTLPGEVTYTKLSMSDATWAALSHAETAGGKAFRVLRDSIDEPYTELVNDVRREGGMKSVMIAVPLRPVTRQPPAGAKSADRIGAVCVGIQKLVAEMAPFCDGRDTNETQLAGFAAKYGKLRSEMTALRQAFSEAEGQFEIAQAQMVHLMEDR